MRFDNFCIHFLLALFNIIYTCIYESLNYARIIKNFPKIFVFLWTFAYLCITFKTKNN